MSWYNYTYLIGEKVKVADEKDSGVVTRIDKERGIIYVMFKKMREEMYDFPESLETKKITSTVTQR